MSPLFIFLLLAGVAVLALALCLVLLLRDQGVNWHLRGPTWPYGRHLPEAGPAPAPAPADTPAAGQASRPT